MKVVILCGGVGTRIKEETEFKPKPIVKIGDKPILWHIMKIYAYYGYKDFILALGYKGEMIKEYFYHYQIMNNNFTINLGNKNKIEIHNENNAEDWNITMVDTGKNALKGARLKRVQKFINDDIFMMTYGDGVADIDIDELVTFHKNHKRQATVTGVFPKMRFGELYTREDGSVNFCEKPDNAPNIINGGFFVFKRTIFDYLDDKDDCDLEYGPLEKIAQNGQLMVYKHCGFWHCMDNIRDMESLNKIWASGKAPWKIW
jgi:glucose-1-phosphate cytidylyltransferase